MEAKRIHEYQCIDEYCCIYTNEQFHDWSNSPWRHHRKHMANICHSHVEFTLKIFEGYKFSLSLHLHNPVLVDTEAAYPLIDLFWIQIVGSAVVLEHIYNITNSIDSTCSVRTLEWTDNWYLSFGFRSFLFTFFLSGRKIIDQDTMIVCFSFCKGGLEMMMRYE